MTYNELLKKINEYRNKYDISIIGKTMLGRNIFAVEKIVSRDFFTAIFIASMHARENITTDLLCKMIDDGLFDAITEFNVSFILMANPDGTELSNFGLTSVNDDKIKEILLAINNQDYDFSRWKANARGVDINNNFDANFGQNIHNKKPSSQGFVGEKSESELETQAIVKYTLSKKVFFTVSYHSKGEEIYFNFFQDKNRLKRDTLIAEQFSKSTGYKIKNVENVSSGGFKDWCVQKLKIPALTIEVGNDELAHPITKRHLNEIYQKHKFVAFDVQFAYNVFIEFENKR